MNDRQEALRQRLRELGFDEVRFARADRALDAPGAALDRWLAAGEHADMEWMARTAEKRRDPRLVLFGAKSAILLGVNYWPGSLPAAGAKWARYALYEDYHDTLKIALQAAGAELERAFGVTAEAYRYYADTGPVLERSLADAGGMGFVGKNAMMISRRFGNWLFLAEILTTIDFEPDPAEGNAREHDRVGLYCGSCTRCMEACPTAAIRAPGRVDARLCISYQTIENKGIIPRALRPGIGNRIYGCDICLEVCPWNRFAQESRRVLLSARYDLAALSLREVLEMDQSRFSAVFRRTPIKRTKLTGLLRNACVVAANTGAVDCLDVLVRLAQHTSPLVRVHAVWAVFVLLGRGAGASRLSAARAVETDAEVLREYADSEVVQPTD